jgi:hypothetical protein
MAGVWPEEIGLLAACKTDLILNSSNLKTMMMVVLHLGSATSSSLK